MKRPQREAPDGPDGSRALAEEPNGLRVEVAGDSVKKTWVEEESVRFPSRRSEVPANPTWVELGPHQPKPNRPTAPADGLWSRR